MIIYYKFFALYKKINKNFAICVNLFVFEFLSVVSLFLLMFSLAPSRFIFSLSDLNAFLMLFVFFKKKH